ncbi:alaserpin-like [Drosophila gunungcola]|uniref:Serpin domain-containing protein n=1 Tax=Drosophila gunungcola TaxID=103775 RepID=A0A9Q0BJI1_9MUSC|nr:alaserpin-like [Drosophila gunungcola]KAI8033724.1 hypothetical protein M5D96_013507 [Drosophila gunungcola]
MTSKAAILLLAMGHLMVAPGLAKPEFCECLAPTYMTRFSAKLFQEIIRWQSQLYNVVFSPFTVHSTLALIYRASEGETFEEVQQVGQFDKQPVFVALDFERLIKFKEHLQGARLTSFSRVFYNQQLGGVNSRYDEFSKFFFDIATEPVDMDGGQDTANRINDWLRRVGVMAYVSPHDITPSGKSSAQMQALLVSTGYFRGHWEHKFGLDNTRSSNFHHANGAASSVRMMYNHDVYALADLPELEATALELAFDESATSLLILLPNRPNGLAHLEQQLARPEFDLNRIASRLHRQSVTVGLPRMRFGSQCNMTNPLKRLGLRKMFTASSGVTKLVDQPVRMDKFLYRSFFSLTEGGTGHVNLLNGKPLPAKAKEVVANRPFFFAIRTPKTVLFMGHVLNPR